MVYSGDGDVYEISLRDQRHFGAGIKRKRVKFVPSSPVAASVQSLPTTPSQSAADKYLSIVFNKPVSTDRAASAPPSEAVSSDETREDGGSIRQATRNTAEPEAICEICHRPVTTEEPIARHESSITHQICLQHSHPPSHIDRRRHGLAVLVTQGWDPDSRRGLGAQGEGILHPIKAKGNPERAGLGMDLKKQPVKVEKVAKLDAGKVRLKEKEGKKKAEKLRDAFYRSEDMEKYFGGKGETNVNLDIPAIRRAKRR